MDLFSYLLAFVLISLFFLRFIFFFLLHRLLMFDYNMQIWLYILEHADIADSMQISWFPIQSKAGNRKKRGEKNEKFAHRTNERCNTKSDSSSHGIAVQSVYSVRFWLNDLWAKRRLLFGSIFFYGSKLKNKQLPISIRRTTYGQRQTVDVK